MRALQPMRRGIGPARFAVMRRFAGFLLGTALSVFAPAAGAQQAVARAAASTPEALAQPVAEPPYDATKHGGLTEAAWLRATRGTDRRSTGMMATGITFDVTGAALMLAGTLVYVNGNNKPCGPTGESVPVLPCSSTTDHVTGMAVMASGVIALGLGLPLTFYGAASVPRAEAAGVLAPTQTLRATGASRGVGGELTISLSLRGAAFALHF